MSSPGIFQEIQNRLVELSSYPLPWADIVFWVSIAMILYVAAVLLIVISKYLSQKNRLDH